MKPAMPNARAPWWMYVVAAVYALAFLFNARQEALGPAASGWAPGPAWSFRVARVALGSPLDRAGLQAGDVLEVVDGLPLKGMPDWFVARANFERERPVELQVRRGEQHLKMQFVITTPGWRTWSREQYLRVSAAYLSRFIVLVLAIVVASSRPAQLSARFAASMFAATAVAEGYPSPGWAATLRHLPGVLSIPICLATASWLLGSVSWLSFFAVFPRGTLTRRWRWGLALVPLVLFAPSLAASTLAMIYAPSALMKPWPSVSSAALARLAQDLAGVAPLLFFDPRLWEPWLLMTVAYLAAGVVIFAVHYRQRRDAHERQRLRALSLALVVLGVIALHNFFTRNWTAWFGTVPPLLFSGAAFVAEALLFPVVPLTLTYAVLAEAPDPRNA